MDNTEKPSSYSIRKVIITILCTLVLGAVGSGLWEKLGGPLFDWLTKVIIRGIAFCFATYKDSIYQEASYGFSEQDSSFLYQLVLCLLPLAYLTILIKHPSRKKNPSERNTSAFGIFINSSRGYYFILVVTCFIFIFSFISFTRASYVRRVIMYSNTTIQRIAPYIDQKTESKLWSQLRSVRTAQDYYQFYGELQNYLKNASLPDYGTKPL